MGGKRLTLSNQILLGVGLGLFLGLFIGERMAFLHVVGTIYIKLLQVTVLPYIIVSLTGSLGKLTLEQASVMARRVSIIFLILWVLTLLSVVLSVFSFPNIETASFFSSSMIPSTKEPDYLALYIPFNPFFSLAQNLVPAVVIFCILMGTALITVEKKELIIEPLDVAAKGLLRITNFFVKLTPIGLFAIAASAAGTMYVEDIKQLQVYILLYIALSLVFTFWILPALVSTFTRVPYVKIFEYFKDALVMAFFTGSVFVVLPLITEKATEIIKRFVTEDQDTQNAVEVIAPASFNFPGSGKLLLLLFIPFAGWMTNTDIGPGRFIELASLGFFTFFGSVNVAIPWLLDFFRIPADIFDLFMMSGIINSRFSTLASAMFTIVVSIAGACAMTSNLRLSLPRLVRYVVTSILGCIGVILVMGLIFRFVVTIKYEKHDIAMEMSLQLKDGVAAKVYDHQPPPLPRPPSNVPLTTAIKERGVIRVGYPLEDKMPFSYHNKKGELVGLSIDLAYQLAKDMGVGLELVPIDDRHLAEELNSAKVDVVMGHNLIIPETALRLNFTQPFMYETMALVMEDYKRSLFQDMNDLREKAVVLAVPDIPYYKNMMKDLFPKARLRPIGSVKDFFLGRYKEADAMVYTAEGGAFMTLIYPRYSVVVPRGLNIRLPLAFPVRMGGQSLARFMDAWIAMKTHDGTLDRLVRYWIKGENAKPKRPRWCIARDLLHIMD